MRGLLVLALVGCGTDGPGGGSAQLVLDIPNGVLDPAGYTSVEVTLHEPSGDIVRSAAIGPDGAFDLGDLDPRKAVSIEAVLRNDSGAAVGYGRTAAAADLEAGQAITVQVRRPIVYVAGVNYYIPDPPAQQSKVWFGLAATYSDLSAEGELDGTATVADKPVLMISAGPELYALDHAVSSTSGTLSGPATLRAVSTADHAMSPPLGMLMQGIALDGAGTDDGATLVIGTTERLYVVDTRPGAPMLLREVATGSFARIAIVSGADGHAGAVAIQDRVDTAAATCSSMAKVWWIPSLGGEVDPEVNDARVVATAGFADIAADRGRAWYVDACKGELGEVTADGARPVRADLGKPTALAVSNGQAWIGLERAATAMAPATLALEVAPVEATSGVRRTLWVEPQEQILGATFFPGVERRLAGQSATFQQLEVGAGGEYVAAATAGKFFGPRVSAANFPQMDLETRELRVFDAATGGIVQRYRTWCDGVFTVVSFNDIDDWSCATTTGQGAPDDPLREHRLSSMTFLFGKK
jgi:hypothetical protein